MQVRSFELYFSLKPQISVTLIPWFTAKALENADSESEDEDEDDDCRALEGNFPTTKVCSFSFFHCYEIFTERNLLVEVLDTDEDEIDEDGQQYLEELERKINSSKSPFGITTEIVDVR